MEWYWIVALTLLGVWTVGLILSQIDEDYAVYWAVGLLYPLLRVLLYPIWAARQYEESRVFYEKRGITKLQFLFGKRAKEVN